MMRKGVDRIFFAGTPLDEITDFVKSYGTHKLKYRSPGRKSGVQGADWSDRAIAKRLFGDYPYGRPIGGTPPGLG